MSQKNHEITDGRLVQTDKKYSHLKLRQKEKIAEWMFQETRDFYTKKYTPINKFKIQKTNPIPSNLPLENYHFFIYTETDLPFTLNAPYPFLSIITSSSILPRAS